MPGLTAPSDYSKEPPRHPCLKINSKASLIVILIIPRSHEPFNVEPPRSALTCSYATPSNLFYKRNHGPIPIVEDIERYSVLVEKPKQLFMKDIRILPKYNVTTTLQVGLKLTRNMIYFRFSFRREWKEQGKALVLKKKVFKY
ncbi:hypothetical protein Ahy_B03g067161 isoform D [Arachis hypogaea]|uniref:Uncharacterized protein n=1 Tax=Arachis hypogaea TaxID=3818 RepID=A0A445A611_ARAHY|nr:hypothetical protein Ahy_B03g067161 isoform D [Arachis hypogaea]